MSIHIRNIANPVGLKEYTVDFKKWTCTWANSDETFGIVQLRLNADETGIEYRNAEITDNVWNKIHESFFDEYIDYLIERDILLAETDSTNS